MPSKHSSDRDRSRGRSRHRSSSRSRSDGRSKEQRFIDNWNAFMKSYSHEYTNGYYTGPKSYHPDYPEEPKVLSGDAPRRRIPKAVAYNNNDDGYDSGPDTSKGKGKGRAYSPRRSRFLSRPRSSQGSSSSYTVPPYAPEPPYYSGYVPTYAPENSSQGYSSEYYPYPQNSGYEANGQESYTLNGASVFNAVHPSDMPGPFSSGHDYTRTGRDYSRGRTRHRDDSSGPSYDYDRDYSRGARPSSIYSNAPFVPYSRSASCAPSYIPGRSYSQPASRSHSRGAEGVSYGSGSYYGSNTFYGDANIVNADHLDDIASRSYSGGVGDVSYSSGSYYSSGVSYGGANIVNAEHPDDVYRSTSRPSAPSRHHHHYHSGQHRSHSNGSRRRSKSLHHGGHHSGHHSSHRSRHRSPSRHRSSHRSRHGSPSRRHHRSHRSGHRSGHRSHRSSHRSRRHHRSHHHHHHSRPRGSSRYVEESYYSSRTSRKGKKKSGGFLEKVKDLFH